MDSGCVDTDGGQWISGVDVVRSARDELGVSADQVAHLLLPGLRRGDRMCRAEEIWIRRNDGRGNCLSGILPLGFWQRVEPRDFAVAGSYVRACAEPYHLDPDDEDGILADKADIIASSLWYWSRTPALLALDSGASNAAIPILSAPDSEATSAVTAEENDTGCDVHPTEAKTAYTDRSGGPGRPSSMHIFEKMLRDRAAAGMMCQSLAEEVRALRDEFISNAEYSGLSRPTEKAIKNRIRIEYKRLKASSGA